MSILRSLRSVAAIAAGTLASLSAGLACAGAVQRSGGSEYEAFAIRYATIPGFRVSGLVAGADTSRRMDIGMMVWLVRGTNRTILVDAGFQRADLIQRWRPTGYVKPSEAVARGGVAADEVTDLIITHIHWDHFDGADLFPNATIWIQRDEVEHHIDSTGKVLDRAIDAPGAQMLARLVRSGRVRLVDGNQEIIEGINVWIGGKHTFQSQFVSAKTGAGTVVFASDNAYLYENLDKRIPIAQTLDAASNLRAQDRMLALASDRRLVVPGHDPEVMKRFPTVRADVVAIR
jgi:glyoxylase-like metal-dependent hydrolase (beta-lactamase superfamily II)